MAHALQGLTHLHADTTITSIDGISAFDLITGELMLTGLTRVEGGQAALPFVRLLFGSPSECLWENDAGQSTASLKERVEGMF